MYDLCVENANGEKIQLTDNRNYDVIGIEGLSPPTATINMSEMVTMDGSRYNSAKIPKRNIVITLNIQSPVEINRINLYKYFRLKQQVTIYYANGSRDVFIKGYVESFETDLFTNSQTIQISILCPDPYFLDSEQLNIELSQLTNILEFPYSSDVSGKEMSRIERDNNKVINIGDIPTGFIAEMSISSGTAESITITNATTNEHFQINYNFLADDVIYLNTQSGQKSVYVIRTTELDGAISYVKTNLLNYMTSDSTWLQLEAGDNNISYVITETAVLNIKLSAYIKYEGV